MSRCSFLKAVCVLLALCSIPARLSPSFADEPKSAALIQTLLKDGTWAEFNVQVKLNGQEIVPKWTARSVGQAFAGGKQCRFLEMEQTCDRPELANMTWRMLIPEDEFGEGKDPLSKAVKIWAKIEGGEPEVVESIALKAPDFAMLVAGPKQNIKNEEAKEKINWQQGDLECSVISGSNDIEFGATKFQMTHRVFRHKDVPFGLAGMQQELKISFGGQMQNATIKVTLRDHGKDAKPKLPDLQP